MKFRHVGIVTQDINNLKQYYQDIGLHPVYDEVEKVRIVKFKEGIELLQYESMSENILRSKGISHVAFTTDPDGNYVEEVCLQD